MSVISIKRYLDHFRPEEIGAPGTPEHAACEALLHEMETTLLAAPAYNDLRPRWDSLTHLLESVHNPGGLPAFQAHAASVLAERHRLEELREQAQGHDVRQILAVLNDALVSLATGQEGATERMQRVERSLQRTAQMNDLPSIKASLRETIRTLAEESEKARAEGAGTLERLDAELHRAREASLGMPGLPGKQDALQALAGAAMPGVAPSLAVACQMDSLRLLRGRYGAPVADELMLAFARSLTGLEDARAYRWSDDALVVLYRTSDTALDRRSALEKRFSKTFDYRVMTGGRAALLAVPVRWMCAAPGDQDSTSLPDEIAQFCKGQRWIP